MPHFKQSNTSLNHPLKGDQCNLKESFTVVLILLGVDFLHSSSHDAVF